MFKIIILILTVFSISILTTGAFAQNIPAVEIIISSETYKFGDKLEYQIIVSEVTNDMQLFTLQMKQVQEASY